MLHMTDDCLGISPHYVVKINAELLEEIRRSDAPYTDLQEMHNRALTVPSAKSERPDRLRLEARFEAFLAG